MSNPIVTNFLTLVKMGTSDEIRSYIKTHFKAFPQDIQDRLAVALMSDAVVEHYARILGVSEEEAVTTPVQN